MTGALNKATNVYVDIVRTLAIEDKRGRVVCVELSQFKFRLYQEMLPTTGFLCVIRNNANRNSLR